MQLYYTGASAPGAPQVCADKSLGGFISGTLVPNGRLSNLFSSISKSTVLKNPGDIRMIALTNTTGAVVNNVIIYSNVSGGHVILQLAAVSPTTNNCGQLVFESVQDGNTLPYQATLAVQEGSDNPINVGSIAIGATVGIWIYRLIDETTFSALNADSNLTAQQLADLLTAQNDDIDESVQLIINWS